MLLESCNKRAAKLSALLTSKFSLRNMTLSFIIFEMDDSYYESVP